MESKDQIYPPASKVGLGEGGQRGRDRILWEIMIFKILDIRQQ